MTQKKFGCNCLSREKKNQGGAVLVMPVARGGATAKKERPGDTAMGGGAGYGQQT